MRFPASRASVSTSTTSARPSARPSVSSRRRSRRSRSSASRPSCTPSTIDRIIDVFPAEQQEQVRIMIANSLQGVVTQTLLPTADGQGRVAALEILLPDDAVRNLIRQAKIEQVYSIMQTNTARGMQTMEQALADLTLRRVVNAEDALTRSSRPEQLLGILERGGFDVEGARAVIAAQQAAAPQPQPQPAVQPQPVVGAGLRVAGPGT